MTSAVVWQISDLFRGTAEPSRYRIYILALVFLKYLTSLAANEEVVVPSIARFDSLLRVRNDSCLGARINKALQSIEEANKHKLDGVLSRIDFTNDLDLGERPHRDKQLARAIELLDQAGRISSSDEQARLLEAKDLWRQFLESSSAEGRVARSFITPPGLASLMAGIGSPQDGDRICDPFAGSGSLLIETAEAANTASCTFFGQEVNYREWLVCRMNLFVHGVYGSRLEFGDSLRNPLLLEANRLMKFDLVMSNPPFGLKNWAEAPESDQWERYGWGVPPSVSGDWAILSHILSTLSDRGRAVVVVPYGVLFRRGSEGRIRQRVVEENLIESIIYLPSNVLGGTTVPLALLAFSKAKIDDLVTFIDGRGRSGQAQDRVHLGGQAAEEILAIWNGDFSKGLACRTSIDEIAEHHFDLSLQHYLGQESWSEPADADLTWKKLERVESELMDTWGELSAAIRTLE